MQNRISCWRELISIEMEKNGEQWTDLVATTLSEAELDLPFDYRYGRPNGKPFTAWSKRYVYFPAQSDRFEWCGSVSRDPNGVATKHQGGE